MAVKKGVSGQYEQKSLIYDEEREAQKNIAEWIDGLGETDVGEPEREIVHHTYIENPKNELETAALDFYLSREAMLCTVQTMRYYHNLLGRIVAWCEERGITKPDQITTSVVRQLMAELASRNLKAWYIHGFARVMRTFLLFCYNEGHTKERVVFPMPRVGKQRLPVLNQEQVKKLIKACKTPREKALILFMVDTGLRLREVINLNWGDVNLQTGTIVVRIGKGNKSRLVAAGAQTCRSLLVLKKVENCNSSRPVFQTRSETRLTPMGLRSILTRLSKTVGFSVSAHMLRRTCATLALKAGQDLVTVQATLGHTSVETTRNYIQLLDEEVLASQRRLSPVDHLK